MTRRTRVAALAALGVLLTSLGLGSSTVWAQDESNARPTIIMKEGLAPTRTSPENQSQVTLFGEGENAWLGKLRIKPGASLEARRETSETFLFVLRGEGTLTVDGQSQTLRAAMGARVPAGSQMSFENSDRLLVALQFFAGPEAANRYSAWRVGELALTEGNARKRPRKARRKKPRSQKSVVHRKSQVRTSPDAAVEIAEIASGDSAWMGLLRVGAGATLPTHRDPTEEYLYVLRGKATLVVDGTKYPLEPHTGVYIPSKAEVSLNNEDKLFSAVQWFAGPESANKYEDWDLGSPTLQPEKTGSSSDDQSLEDTPSLQIN